MSSSSESSICCISADDGAGLFPVPADVEADPFPVSADVEADTPAAEVLGPAVGLFKPEVLVPAEVLEPAAGDMADDDGVVGVVLLGIIFRFCVSSFEAFLRLRICFCRSSRILLIDFNLII